MSMYDDEGPEGEENPPVTVFVAVQPGLDLGSLVHRCMSNPGCDYGGCSYSEEGATLLGSRIALEDVLADFGINPDRCEWSEEQAEESYP